MSSQSVFYASVVTAGLVFSSAAHANVLITVDKSTQHMTVSVDGTTRYEWPVSTGRPGFDTPNGTFRPQWMTQMHHSNEYENAPMPHSIFFTGGDAIHGFTGTPFGVAAVSHGCVRLPLRQAASLYELVRQEGMPNTTIVVRGSIPRRPMVAQQGRSIRYAQQGYARQGSVFGSNAQAPVYYARQQDYYGHARTQQPFGFQQSYGAQPAYRGTYGGDY